MKEIEVTCKLGKELTADEIQTAAVKALGVSPTIKQQLKYRIVFTKLDETGAFGNMLNLRLRVDAPMSYVTNGQNVPDDIEEFNAQKIVRILLGGRD